MSGSEVGFPLIRIESTGGLGLEERRSVQLEADNSLPGFQAWMSHGQYLDIVSKVSPLG